MIPYSWFLDAQNTISPYINKTPCLYDQNLDIYLKFENHQVTGSFKARGAINKVLSLQPWEIERGIITASAGNHGLGVAYAGTLVKTKVTVFVPENAVLTKINAIRALNATIKVIEGGYADAESAGRNYALENNLVWISPYNDGKVIAGQGTIVLEVLNENHNLNQATWVVPVGGGGLISGIGGALDGFYKSNNKQSSVPLNIIGVQSTASPFMATYFYKGNQNGCADLPSIADGLAGPIEPDSITFPIIKKYVKDILLVSEEDIKQAINYASKNYMAVIEGSAAVGLAVVLLNLIQDRPIVVIVSGRNIQPEIYNEIIGDVL